MSEVGNLGKAGSRGQPGKPGAMVEQDGRMIGDFV
jgi:hypothetical protein